MKFSTSIEYAVHGLVYLTNASRGEAMLMADIAHAVHVPEAYLRKVFQQLARNGIVTSQRGARGGFSLAREPQQISLRDVVEAIDGPMQRYSCLELERGCAIGGECSVRGVFDRAAEQLAEVLGATSIKDLMLDLSQHASQAAWLGSPAERLNSNKSKHYGGKL